MPARAAVSMVWDRTTPCTSCPYRRDAPRGLWHATEFVNLMQHDGDLFGAMFGCHEFNKRPPEEHRPCAGWLLDQKKRGVPSIRLRMTLSSNPKALACFEKADPAGLPLFDSIEEMVAANIERPKVEPKPKQYRTPCRSCGETRVRFATAPAGDADREIVIGTCVSCESIRCRYERSRLG